MGFWYDHVENVAEQIDDYEPTFTIEGDGDHSPSEQLKEQFRYGAVRAAVQYAFDSDIPGHPSGYLTMDNITKMYITFRFGFPASIVIELADLPGDSKYVEAEYVTYYWNPKPGLSGQETVTEVQIREGR